MNIKLILPNFFLLAFFSSAAISDENIQVQDDSGKLITLNKPAEKIVSLSPHITELLFAAGAGNKVVGTIIGSDYPEQALEITKIGRAGMIDYEKVLALKPDLIVGWINGNRKENIARLKKMGFKVFMTEPQQLEDISKNIKKLGLLADTSNIAEKSAQEFSHKLKRLKEKYKNKKPVTVFYQLWHKPMLTINKKHIISNVIKLCGGTNIFGEHTAYVPSIDTESVLIANPDVIITADKGDKMPSWLESWKQWQTITAAKKNNLFWVNPDWIHRHTPRILLAAEKICINLDSARKQ